jgi:hypothetical protein
MHDKASLNKHTVPQSRHQAVCGRPYRIDLAASSSASLTALAHRKGQGSESLSENNGQTPHPGPANPVQEGDIPRVCTSLTTGSLRGNKLKYSS